MVEARRVALETHRTTQHTQRSHTVLHQIPFTAVIMNTVLHGQTTEGRRHWLILYCGSSWYAVKRHGGRRESKGAARTCTPLAEACWISAARLPPHYGHRALQSMIQAMPHGRVEIAHANLTWPTAGYALLEPPLCLTRPCVP